METHTHRATLASESTHNKRVRKSRCTRAIPWLLGWDIFDVRTALSVSSVVRWEMGGDGELSDAWHVSGELRALLNRTPISNEYREESPRVLRISNAVEGKGYRAESLWERYAVVIIFCYSLSHRHHRGCGFSARKSKQTRPITRRT